MLGRTPKLPWDWTSVWLVALTSAAMGFLACLGLAAASGASALAQSWTEDLESRATVSVALPDETPEGRARTLEQALKVIRAAPGVGDARALEPEETQALVAPWLGDDPELTGLALPALIDVELASGARLDAEALSADLDAADLSAEVDMHGRWVARLRPAAARLRGFAYGAVAILVAAAGLVVAMSCATGLASQGRMVEVLKLIGATDHYVARIFVRRLQTVVFAGSALGAALAALALARLSDASASPAEAAELAPLLPSLAPSPWFWPLLALTPVGFTLIATLSARATVLLALRRRTI